MVWRHRAAARGSGPEPEDARPAAKADRVDVSAKGEVQTSLLLETPDADFVGTLHQQVMALGNAGDWTFETRVVWLDRQIDHGDIPLGESAEFLRKAIRGLMTSTLFALNAIVFRRRRTHRWDGETARDAAVRGDAGPGAQRGGRVR